METSEEAEARTIVPPSVPSSPSCRSSLSADSIRQTAPNGPEGELCQREARSDQRNLCRIRSEIRRVVRSDRQEQRGGEVLEENDDVESGVGIRTWSECGKRHVSYSSRGRGAMAGSVRDAGRKKAQKPEIHGEFRVKPRNFERSVALRAPVRPGSRNITALPVVER